MARESAQLLSTPNVPQIDNTVTTCVTLSTMEHRGTGNSLPDAKILPSGEKASALIPEK